MYRALVFAVLLLIVGSLFGCSLSTVHAPDTRDMACTTDNVAPAIDSVVALNSAVGTIGYATAADGAGQDPTWALVGGILVSGVYAYSAYSGFSDTAKCREHIHNEFDKIRGERTGGEESVYQQGEGNTEQPAE